ncbi:MAG: hypothetical protein ACRELB_06050 [Polyangiaceae bacterium]
MEVRPGGLGRRLSVGVCATLGVLGLAGEAAADPLRLRADALAETQSPTGLVVLQGEDHARPWFDVEGLVWAGAKPTLTGDVLVLAARMREPHGYGELRVGRFVLATGAILPVQIDGVEAVGRAPWGSTVETFGGLPVVPRFGPRAYDWLAGGRVAQSIASRVTLGVSYLERRDDGEISGEDLGMDFAAAPARWFDLAARGTWDLVSPGIADALVSAATRVGDWRFELYGADRSPARLLPATSLFSVLGDFPSQSVGGTVKWRAAPRLDLLASGAGQDVGGALGGNGWVRGTLRLDYRGDGDVGLEVRRVDVSTAQWTGVRAIAAQPLGRGFRYSSEVEIVVPDHPDGHGAAWPWGLMALSWRSHRAWEVAGALEASSTPQHRYEADALLRVAYVFGGAPSNPASRAGRGAAR